MKAVILAAGKGTRMGTLTRDLPKPMLPVHGRPILEHILDGLRNAGLREVILITGWQAEVIEHHFGDGSQFGLRIAYARQEVQDGTGHAPLYAREFVGSDDFLLTYGDILVSPETYPRLVERFQSQPVSGALTVTVGEDVSKGGLNFFDDDFHLLRLVEKPGPAQLDALRQEGLLIPGRPLYYNAGIYMFRSLIFDYLDRLQPSVRGEYELTDAISQLLADGHRIAGLEIAGRWVDVRDPEVLRSLEVGQSPVG